MFGVYLPGSLEVIPFLFQVLAGVRNNAVKQHSNGLFVILQYEDEGVDVAARP